MGGEQNARQSLPKRQWKIETVDLDTGEPTGSIFDKHSSQMLRHPKDGEFLETAEVKEDDASGKKEDTTDIEVQIGSTDGGERNILTCARLPNNGSGELNKSEPAVASSGLCSSTGSKQRPGQNDDDKDLPHCQGDIEQGGNVLNPNNFAVMHGIENEGWTVKKKPLTGKTIGVGSKVQERIGQKRLGVVMVDDQEGNDNPHLWSIPFNGEKSLTSSSKTKGSQRDTRALKQKLIEDSTPDHPLHGFGFHGVTNFDFDNPFQPTKLESNKETVTFPFLVSFNVCGRGIGTSNCAYSAVQLWMETCGAGKRTMSTMSSELAVVCCSVFFLVDC